MPETLPLIYGAVSTGLLDGALEAIYELNPEKWGGKFPYIHTINPLPPLDDWIVLGVPLAVYGAGKWKKKEELKDIGLGGLLYAIPMFIHHIIIRSIWMWQGKLGKFETPVKMELPLIKEI